MVPIKLYDGGTKVENLKLLCPPFLPRPTTQTANHSS